MQHCNLKALLIIAMAVCSSAFAITNTADINIDDVLHDPAMLNNNSLQSNLGSIFIAGANKYIGAINGAANVNIGMNSEHVKIDTTFVSNQTIRDVANINVHQGTFISQHAVINCGSVNNYAKMYIRSDFSSETLTNHAGGFLSIQTTNLHSPIINTTGGYISIDQKAKSSKNIENYGEMLIANSLEIRDFNNAGSVIAKANLITSNFNNTGVIEAAAPINSVALYNSGIFNTAAPLTVNTIMNNSGHMKLARELSAPIFNNSGNLFVNEKLLAKVAEFNSPGTINFSIRSQASYGIILNNAPINIADGQIKVNAFFVGEANKNYSWCLLKAPVIETNENTKITIPHSNFHYTWTSSLDHGTFTVSYSREPLTNYVPQGLQADIAVSLEQIAVASTTDEHIAFINAVSGCSCHEEYNTNLIKLKPNANSNAHFVAMHNTTFKKVETRISALQDSSSALRGIAVGDLGFSSASWGAVFGSVANQKAITGNLGYRATAFGAIFGIDKQVPNDDIYGVAAALSNTNITEGASINSKTHITGYHILGYGTNFFYGDNFFEWLFTGIINQNKGEREVIVAATNLNVGSSYHNYQVGARINLGKNMDFHTWGLAQVNTLQYSFLHQPSYNENGSPAALRIARFDSNVVTLGSGLRFFGRPDFHSSLVAKPAIHAMVTYDAVSSSQGVTASFILGGSDFTIYQNPSRVAVKLGADIGCEIKERVQLQFSYDLELRSRYSDNSAELKLKYLF